MSRLLFLVGVGSLGLLLGPVAAHADSISTLTVTSVDVCHCDGVNRWTLSGDSLFFSGEGAATSVVGFETDGQPLVPLNDPVFGTTFGGSNGDAIGSATIDGVTHAVILTDGLPFLEFPSDFVYHHTVVGPSANQPFSDDIVAEVPALIVGDQSNNRPVPLQEITSCQNNQVCYGNVVADAYIDVPGIATLRGYKLSGDTSDTITYVSFTPTPEPVSYGLTFLGLAAMLILVTSKKRKLHSETLRFAPSLVCR